MDYSEIQNVDLQGERIMCFTKKHMYLEGFHQMNILKGIVNISRNSRRESVEYRHVYDCSVNTEYSIIQRK